MEVHQRKQLSPPVSLLLLMKKNPWKTNLSWDKKEYLHKIGFHQDMKKQDLSSSTESWTLDFHISLVSHMVLQSTAKRSLWRIALCGEGGGAGGGRKRKNKTDWGYDPAVKHVLQKYKSLGKIDIIIFTDKRMMVFVDILRYAKMHLIKSLASFPSLKNSL